AAARLEAEGEAGAKLRRAEDELVRAAGRRQQLLEPGVSDEGAAGVDVRRGADQAGAGVRVAGAFEPVERYGDNVAGLQGPVDAPVEVVESGAMGLAQGVHGARDGAARDRRERREAGQEVEPGEHVQ